MIYLVIAVIFLYLISISLAFGVDVDINTDENIGKITVAFFFIPVFKKRINIKKIVRQKEERQEQDDEENKDDGNTSSNGFKKFLLACVINILKRVRARNVNLHAKIGTGDAAADGVAVGMLRIFYTQFCTFFNLAPDGDRCIIEPEYDAEILLFLFFGIFSISFADIIIAVLCTVFERIKQSGRRSYANVAE